MIPIEFIKNAPPEVEDVQNDSYSDDILSLLNSTKFHIDALKVNLEEAESVGTAEKDSLLFDLEKLLSKTKNGTTEAKLLNAGTEMEAEIPSGQGQNHKSKMEVIGPEEDEGEILTVEDQPLVFIKSEDASLDLDLIDEAMDVDNRGWKTFQDTKTKSNQEELHWSECDKEPKESYLFNEKGIIKEEANYVGGGGVHDNENESMIENYCKYCEDGEVHLKCDSDQRSASDEDPRSKSKLSTKIIFSCNSCDYETRKEYFLEKHKRLQHNEFKRIQCPPDCRYKTSKQRYLDNHTQLNHGPNAVLKEEIIFCKNCEYETTLTTKIRKHSQIVHKKTDDGFRSCPDCDYKTSKMFDLEKHIRVTHSANASEDTDGCQYCELNTNRSTMKGRLRSQITNYGCSACPQRCFTMSQIKRHIRRRHNNSDAKWIRLNCKLCMYKTTNDPTNQKAKRKKKKSCMFKTTKDPTDQIGQATKAKHKKKKSCPLCSANIEHQRCQTSASNPIQQCQLCGEFKSTMSGLREHMRASHPLEKLFNCDKCAYKCNWLPNLNVHKNAKHEKVKIQCDKCDFSSTWKVAVNEHMRSKHGIFQKNTKYKDLMEFKEVICENCGFKGTSKMAMNLHSKSGCDRWV